MQIFIDIRINEITRKYPFDSHVKFLIFVHFYPSLVKKRNLLKGAYFYAYLSIFLSLAALRSKG